MLNLFEIPDWLMHEAVPCGLYAEKWNQDEWFEAFERGYFAAQHDRFLRSNMALLLWKTGWISVDECLNILDEIKAGRENTELKNL